MKCGAQLSLYVMADDFVRVILSSLDAIAPYRDRLRGCPGEPDMDICSPEQPSAFDEDLERRKTHAAQAVTDALSTDQRVAVQFSLYPLGPADYMDEIYGCIDFLKASPVFDRAKNYCTRLAGDAGPVFEALSQAWLSFGDPNAHVAIDLTASANSPSKDAAA